MFFACVVEKITIFSFSLEECLRSIFQPILHAHSCKCHRSFFLSCFSFRARSSYTFLPFFACLFSFSLSVPTTTIMPTSCRCSPFRTRTTCTNFLHRFLSSAFCFNLHTVIAKSGVSPSYHMESCSPVCRLPCSLVTCASRASITSLGSATV